MTGTGEGWVSSGTQNLEVVKITKRNNGWGRGSEQVAGSWSVREASEDAVFQLGQE